MWLPAVLGLVAGGCHILWVTITRHQTGQLVVFVILSVVVLGMAVLRRSRMNVRAKWVVDRVCALSLVAWVLCYSWILVSNGIRGYRG